MNSKHKKLWNLVFSTFIFGLCIFNGHSASALSGSDLEVQKALLNGVWDCYSNGSVGAPISLQPKNGFTVYSGGKSILKGSNSREQNIALPTYFSGIAASGVTSTPHQISCQSLLFGGESFNGIFSINSINAPPADTSNQQSVTNYLNGMGYDGPSTSDSSSDNKTCIAIYFTDSRTEDFMISDKICFSNLDSSGKVTDNTTVTVEDVKHEENNGSPVDYDPIQIVQSGNRAFKIEDGAWWKTKITINNGDAIVSNNDTNAIANQMIKAAQSAYVNGCRTKTSDDQMRSWQYCLAQKDGTSIYYDPNAAETDSATYTLKQPVSNAFEEAREYLKLPSQSAVYTATNKFILYQSYLAQYYNLSVVCNGSQNAEETSKAAGAGYTETVYAYHDGKFQDCLINVGNLDGNKKVMAVVDGVFDGSVIDASQVISELNNLKGVAVLSADEASRIGKYRNGIDSDGNYISDPAETEPRGLDDPSNPDDSNTDPNDICYGAEGTLGLSWIICPVAQTLYDGLNWVYTDIAGQFLPIDGVSFFSTDNQVYKAWQTFQTFANIIVVILLLVVIFSQLTGYGIDNYGIKKILPRLIIVAILVNLSYFIAQFLVDISNIIGSSIGNIFGIVDVPQVSTGGVDGAAVTILGAGATIGAVALAFNIFINPAVVLGFLLTCLSGLLAVLTMWVILVARQVGVIIAVVVSPIVFACYLLPNTSKVTKGWVNLMKGLLLLYPLCALLIGGSAFVSDLFKSVSDNQIMFLAAILIRVLPFFALPTLFRKSINAMGSLGATIQGIGRGFSRNLTTGIRRSEGYGRAVTAVNNFNPFGIRDTAANTRFGRALGWNRTRARQIAAYDKQQGIDREAREKLQRNISQRMEIEDPMSVKKKEFQKRLNAAILGRDQTGYQALLADATSRFGASKAEEMFRQSMLSAGENGMMARNRRAGFLRAIEDQFGAKFGAKDFGMSKYLQNGGTDSDGNLVSIEQFENNPNNIKVGDLSPEASIGLSANNIQRMMDAGLITRNMSQEIRRNKEMWNKLDPIQQLMFAHHAATGRSITKDDVEASLTGNAEYDVKDMNGNTIESRAATYTSAQSADLIRPMADDVNIASQSSPLDTNIVGQSAPLETDTVIRDVRWRNEEGGHSQTDPLIVSQSTPPAQNNSPRIDMPDGTYYQNGTHYNANGQQIP